MSQPVRAAPRTVPANGAVFADLVTDLQGGPVMLDAGGQPVAVLVAVDQFRDMQAVYEWHERVLREHRRS